MGGRVYTRKIKDNQRIMICSDGIMDGLWEKNIQEMLAEKKPVPEIMGNLSRKAIENDDKDDTTLIVAEISRI